MARQSLPKRNATRSRNPNAAVASRRSKPPSAAKPKTKLESVVNALRAPKGATLAQLMKLTGWQMHTVRGAMSGALKKQRGLNIVSTKTGDERVYRIEASK